jgi:hypothetical protein
VVIGCRFGEGGEETKGTAGRGVIVAGRGMFGEKPARSGQEKVPRAAGR